MPDTPDPGAPQLAPDTTRLDQILVVGAVLIVAMVLIGLFLVSVPQANLPIISSITSALVASVISGYAGYRWGASKKSGAAQ